MGYHGPSNELCHEKQNMVKSSPESESQVRSNSASPHNSPPNQTKNSLKRRGEDSFARIGEIDRKHAKTEGIQKKFILPLIQKKQVSFIFIFQLS